MEITWERADNNEANSIKRERKKFNESFVVPWETVEEYKSNNSTSNAFEKVKNKFIKSNNTISNNEVEKAEALKKYKELLDCGAITKEEFERKKKELL